MRSLLLVALFSSALLAVVAQTQTSVAPQATLAAPQELRQITAGSYPSHKDFVGAFSTVPMNPTQHLLKDIQEDKTLVASILRAPMDLGDPANCKHSDLEKDERELRKMALRINHRRVALKQQDAWIRSATEGLARIESEIETTHATAKNLAEQLDSLEAQRTDLGNHIRREALLKELDNQSSGLMRLKDHRMSREVGLQKKHNEFALRNHKHNQVLAKLNQMRTGQGLTLGKLDDPKPYVFMESSNAAETEDSAEIDAEIDEAADAADDEE